MQRLYPACVALIAMVTLFQSTQAIKFELPGQTAADALPVCISHYIDSDVKYIVKVKVGSGPHQKVGLEVRGNRFRTKANGTFVSSSFPTHIFGLLAPLAL